MGTHGYTWDQTDYGSRIQAVKYIVNYCFKKHTNASLYDNNTILIRGNLGRCFGREYMRGWLEIICMAASEISAVPPREHMGGHHENLCEDTTRTYEGTLREHMR